MNKVLDKVLSVALDLTWGREFPLLTGEPKPGRWYRIKTSNCISSDGTPWYGHFRKGTEKKLIVMFHGGGVSVDAFTAARPHTVPGGFYNPHNRSGVRVMTRAIGAFGLGDQKNIENPFRGWSMLVVPYCNGDFHSGTSNREYIGLDGKKHTMYYHGYTNYRALLDAAVPCLGEPEALLVTGGSAGGFGTALLADDVIDYFPTAQNVTVLVDGSLLVYDKWRDCAINEWKAPEKIAEQLTTGNITLDSLAALRKRRPDTTILFDCAVRDSALAQTQVYFDEGFLPESATKEHGDRFQELVSEMVEGMRERVPNSGVYIWEKITDREKALMQHTGTCAASFYEKLSGGVSMCQWVREAMDGKPGIYGLDLLNKQY